MKSPSDSLNTHVATPIGETQSKLFQLYTLTNIASSCFIPDDQLTSSSIFGSQKDMEEQADAIIMYFGLNRTH